MTKAFDLFNKKIAIIGLGYVGLPLAVEFGKIRQVIGFDLDEARIRELSEGYDKTLEVESKELRSATHLSFTSSFDDLSGCGVYIVAVPTPIDKSKRPDLSFLEASSKTVGKILSKGDVVIYESTVFPGCTRDICIPLLEEISGLQFNTDFFVGYSPERINPGDRQHRLTSIVKVTSGSTPEAAMAIDKLYASIISAGTHMAESIEVAEAAKVIENTQRDLNIALMNELAIIFNKLGIDTQDVLKAAKTKWNFLPFKPGLVGGHCIGVDPYYLTYRAQEIGYQPEVILAGRRINDTMGNYVQDRVARLMMQKGLPVVGSRILVLGLSFKENCPDIRNSKVIDLIKGFQVLNAEVDVWDPWVSEIAVKHEFGINCLTDNPKIGYYDSIIVAVGHKEFVNLGAKMIRTFAKENAVLYDIKGIFPRDEMDERL